MLVTTSRDPSVKARRFGKYLASFLSLPYLNRGKHNSSKEETWIVVVEDHGNPCGLVKRSPSNEEFLTFTLHREAFGKRMKRLAPVVIGEGIDALRIARFFELERPERFMPDDVARQKRALMVTSGQIDFTDEGQVKFVLKI